ncbi:MAG: HAD family hydrolase, partial [Terrimicrobiaceae bacterium]
MQTHTGGSPARKLLVLDLDETLIHGCPEAVSGDFLAAGIPVFIRPGARDFLIKMADFYELAVWTSASSDYAADIVRELFSSPPQ